MQKHEMRHRQSGFTLIEVSLSSLIILIAIAASGSLYLAQTRMHKKLDRSLSMYTIIDQVISEVSGAPADYPMVVKSDSPSEYLVYVKCMSDKSLDVGAKTPPTGDSGMGFRLMPLSSMGGNPKNKALHNSLDYCPVGVELHISFQSLYNVCVTGLQLSPDPNDPSKTVVSKVSFKSALLNAQLATTVDAMMTASTIMLGCN